VEGPEAVDGVVHPGTTVEQPIGQPGQGLVDPRSRAQQLTVLLVAGAGAEAGRDGQPGSTQQQIIQADDIGGILVSIRAVEDESGALRHVGRHPEGHAAAGDGLVVDRDAALVQELAAAVGAAAVDADGLDEGVDRDLVPELAQAVDLVVDQQHDGGVSGGGLAHGSRRSSFRNRTT
jgi:hypothetical protein